MNLSARIMAYPKYHKEPMGKIYVDQRTKDDACQKIRFVYKAHSAFKGKAFKLPIYEPVDPGEEFVHPESLPLERLLLTHSNPLIVDRDSTYQYKGNIMFGRSRLKEAALKSFDEFINKPESSFVATIEGTSGSGKSLFARMLANEILQNSAKGEYKRLSKKRGMVVYASQINAITERKCFNNWRLILQAMCNNLSKEMNVGKGELLEKLVRESSAKISDKLFFIEELFAAKLPTPYTKESQYQPPDDPIAFIKKQEYPDEVVEQIITFVVEFFRFYLDEQESVSEPSGSASEDSNAKNEEGKEKEKGESLPPAVLFLDDAQTMDKESWRLIDELQDSVQKLAIYIVIRTDQEGELQFASKDVREYFRLMESGDIIGARYALSGISGPHVNELVGIFGGMYVEQVVQEIYSMLQDTDEAKKEERLKELKEAYAVNSLVKEIEITTLDTITAKTEGNPLLTFQFVLSLLKAKYLQNKGGILTPTEEFLRAKTQNDWAFVELPDLAQRVNTMHIDRTLKATSEYTYRASFW